MLETIKRVREEKEGFTLAELLIVVAIILVLVAIAIPVFTGALGNAEKAVGDANIRSVKAAATTDILLNPSEYGVADNTTGWTATATVDGNGNISKIEIATGATADNAEKDGDSWDVTAKIMPSEVEQVSSGG